MKTKLAIAALLLMFSQVTNANLIRNASFEDIPGPGNAQGILPSEWTIVSVTPDTYSNDGSYGLAPSDFGNFPGVTAFDGIRWVAGWSLANETFGQTLSATLTAGEEYTLSAYLLQAKRGDLDFTGGYNVSLTSADFTTTVALLGSLGPTTDSNDWEFSSFSFIAPSNAGVLPFLLFTPYASVGNSAYPGLDALELTATEISEIPLPAAIWLFGTALAGLAGFGRRARRPDYR